MTIPWARRGAGATRDALDDAAVPGALDETLDVLPARARLTREERDAAFTDFVATSSAALLQTAWLLTGDAHRAEDLVQHALVRTYAAWDRVAVDPLAYARRTLANQRIDTWRRRRREVLTDELPERASDDGHGTTDDRDQLVRALALLTPRQRRVVVLRHLVGLPEHEVAAELGVSVGTVKSTASRGLVRLREALREPADATSQEEAR
jgi:RNA polymerase sigma-70 factor (sigma-E family)